MDQGLKLLTQQEVADQLRVPLNTLRFWRYNGEGPKGMRLGRRVLYAQADVDAWIQQQRDAAA